MTITDENGPADRRLARGLASVYLIASANRDEAARSAALDALRADPRATAAPVVGALADRAGPLEEAELGVLHALAETGEEATQLIVAALVEALADERPAAQERAVDGLVALGSDSVPALVKALHDDRRRARAAVALGRCGDRRAGEALIDLLTDRDPALRRVAAETLGELGDPRSAEALFNATKDEDPEAGTAAALALDRLGSLALLVKIAGTWRSAIEAVGGRVRLDGSDSTGDRLQLTINVPAENKATGEVASSAGGALEATSVDTKLGAEAEGDHDQPSDPSVLHEVPAHENAAVTEPATKDQPDEPAGWVATGDEEVGRPAEGQPDEPAGWVATGDEEVGRPAEGQPDEPAGWVATGDEEVGRPAEGQPDEPAGWVATGDEEVGRPAEGQPDEPAGWVATGDEEVGRPADRQPDEPAGWVATADEGVAATPPPREAVDGSETSEAAPVQSVQANETPIPARRRPHLLRRMRGALDRPRH